MKIAVLVMLLLYLAMKHNKYTDDNRRAKWWDEDNNKN